MTADIQSNDARDTSCIFSTETVRLSETHRDGKVVARQYIS